MKLKKLTIPVKVLQIKSLNPVQKLILGLILYSMYDKQYTWITNGYIGDILDLSKQRVSDNISKLCDIGIISTITEDKDGYQKRVIRLNKKFEHYDFICSCLPKKSCTEKTDPPP